MLGKDIKNNKIIPFVLIILVFLSGTFFFSNPKQAQAQWVVSAPAAEAILGTTSANTGSGTASTITDTGISIKNLAKEVLKEVAKGLARKALAELTKSTINWINSGFHGKPLFVENPKSFFNEIAKSEIKDFIDVIGYNNLRFPFGRDYALNVIDSYKRQIDNNLEYSLSRVISDETVLKGYQTDFSYGGWNGFLLTTQYPQNNPIGFRMLASEQLGSKLQGTFQNTAEKAQNTLDRGMGFLSPQTCPSNPKYNNIGNAFIKPAFDEKAYLAKNPAPKVEDINLKITKAEYDEAKAKWIADYNIEKKKWDEKNGCPGGLVDTTPGSVVAASLNKALGGTQDLTLGGVNYGNSLSAIFDALINHYMDKGLNKLATKINPEQPEDEWSYLGQTLGSPTDFTTGTSDWASGPDEVIILSEFKRSVEDGIKNTEAELGFIGNGAGGTSGVLDMLGVLWPKIRELDICQPGPNLGWEDRLDGEKERNSTKLQTKLNDSDGERAAAARATYNELNFAVNFFKDWIKNEMLLSLPHSIDYIEEVKTLDDLSQLATEMSDRKNLKTSALARLRAIKASLDQITTQPAPGGGQEEVVVNLKRQYNSVRTSISNLDSLEDIKNELNILKDRYTSLNELVIQCKNEKATKGWSTATTQTAGPEQRYFCDAPIVGGYNHGTFINKGRVTHPAIPMVNAGDVFRWRSFLGLIGHRVDIEINCNLVYRSNVLDYKGSLPGLTTITEPYLGDIDYGSGGQCADTGNKYESELQKAIDSAINKYPDAANKQNIEDSSGKKENARAFLELVASEVRSNGLNATAEVLNGNNNPSTGDIIAIWKNGDTYMERYDAIVGDNTKTVGEATMTAFDAFIPLNCTSAGGGNDCGCRTVTNNDNEGGSCNFASGSYGNDSGAPAGPINPSSVIFEQGDGVGNWAETATLSSVSADNSVIRLNYDKSGVWPNSTLVTEATNANPWIVIWRNGAWRATTFSWLRPNQTEKDVGDVFFGGLGGGQTFGNFKPVAGERYGFMVSGIARDMSMNNVRERSNILMYTWPSVSYMCENDGGENPPTQPPIGGTSPFVSYVSPTNIKQGGTIFINGQNLTNTVQFFDANGNRTTILGSVNQDKTSVSAIVPTDMPSGSGTVRVYKDASTVSNSKNIQISSTGSTGGNIETVTPLSTLVPTGIDRVGYLDRIYQNGWWPSISPDGKYVAFGNWGDSFVLDLGSGETTPQWNFNNPPGLPSGDDTNCLAGQWLSNTKLMFVCEIGSQGQGGFYRYEVTVGEWIPKKMADSPSVVIGSMIRAQDGHWASYLPASRITKDGQLISSSNIGGAISLSGDVLVHACTNDNQSICVRNGTTLTKTYPAKTPMHLTDVESGYIAYGGYGPIHGITPTGTDLDLTVVPWRWENLGKLLLVNGNIWTVTTTWDSVNEKGYVLLRPWGSKKTLAVDAPAVHVDVVYKDGKFIIAYNDEVGNIQIKTISATAELKTIN